MKKFLPIPAICILALLAGGLLWYTRPQSFWEATGTERDSITGASGVSIEISIQDRNLTMQAWEMDILTPGQEDYEALLALLEGTTYRASLRNFLPPSLSNTSRGVTVTAEAGFASGDELVTVSANSPGKVWVFSLEDDRSLVFSVSPRDLNETLADFIQQRGVLVDS